MRLSWLPLIAAPVAIYAALVVVSDAQKVASNMLSADAGLYLAFAGLWSCAVLLRAARWHAYMRLLGDGPGFWRGSLYFLSGFSMLVSPGRVGELIRAPLLKRDYGVPASRTAAAVFVERFYDALASASAIAAALAFADVPATVMAAPLLVSAALVTLVLNCRLLEAMLRRARRLRWAGRLVPDPGESMGTMRTLLGRRAAARAVPLSAGVVALEAAAFYALAASLGIGIDFASASAAFHASSFIGALSLVPAGLGVFEGGLSGLLLLQGVPEDEGFAASVMLRIVATGLFTGVGLACLRAVSGSRPA